MNSYKIPSRIDVSLQDTCVRNTVSIALINITIMVAKEAFNEIVFHLIMHSDMHLFYLIKASICYDTNLKNMKKKVDVSFKSNVLFV